uniref:Uncharacterized protein n=1 Tax=Arundo donax TaxID=35708 RepID=A0A0A9DE24_ARUDO
MYGRPSLSRLATLATDALTLPPTPRSALARLEILSRCLRRRHALAPCLLHGVLLLATAAPSAR